MQRLHRRLVVGSCALASVLVAVAGLAIGLSAQKAAPAAGARIPATLFGANAPWHELGHYIVVNGELVRDRSFRLDQRFWRPVVVGNGAMEFSKSGGAAGAAGFTTYAGHATLTVRAAKTLACAYQRLHDRIEPGEYTLEFSSRGDKGKPALMLVLVDKAYAKLSREAFDTTETDQWKRHSVTLQVQTSAMEADLGLCVASAGTVQIDEVRLFRAQAAPAIDPAVKKRIVELGIRSLRWPGGSDVNTLDWRQTIGPLRTRGEQSLIYGGLQTPSFGLHEFLNLCQELDLAPVIVVNPLDTPASAAALVEYILGDPASEQGRIRASHGQRLPWRFATRFEIGNEPAKEYGTAGELGTAGAKYAERALAISTRMKDAAKRSGQPIDISGVAEGAMQLADWLSPRGNTITSLLANWNAQVFGNGPGATGVTAAHAHYYTFFEQTSDSRRHFENLMSSGEVLRRTLDEKIRPFTKNLPVWITEYQVLIESKSVVQAQFTKDFASGLAVGDMLMTLIKEDIPIAHIHDLSEVGAFGLLGRGQAGWYLRPAAQVFKMFSVTAGDPRVDLEVGVRGPAATYRVDTGAGNIPGGLTYQRVSGLATIDAKTNRPRVFLLNRDFSTNAVVTLRIAGYNLGGGTAHWYQHKDLAANNDGRNPNEVSVRSEKIKGGSPWSIMVPSHTLVRIDFD